jgi:hypothetical protein
MNETVTSILVTITALPSDVHGGLPHLSSLRRRRRSALCFFIFYWLGL